MDKTIFQLHKEAGKVPFVVAKEWWRDRFAIVVCSVQDDEKGQYARGFSISFNSTSMGFEYSNYLEKYEAWRKYMLIPASSKPEWVGLPNEFFNYSNLMEIYNHLKQKAQNARNNQSKIERR
jgi:hypothetical protein